MCKFIFGITGGSGSGKTTVSNILKSLGVYIIDTDIISRQVTGKDSPCLRELTEAFGEEILNEDKSLNRRRLASLAFGDKEKTALLSRITHKYIKKETEKRIEGSPADIIGIDGAVIIGSEIESLCEKMVVVTADKDVRIRRITERDNISEGEAEKRLAVQKSDDFYRSNGDYVIDNSLGVEELRRQTRLVYNKLKGD